MKDVMLALNEKGKDERITQKIGENDVDLKISVEYFGGDIDYLFIYGADLQIKNVVNADLNISMAKLQLN
jgi:hypothetical protein